jgi:hypothetical protein
MPTGLIFLLGVGVFFVVFVIGLLITRLREARKAELWPSAVGTVIASGDGVQGSR